MGNPLQSRAVANADRIAELYRGEILNAETQRRARDRVDWLVAQAHGDVLDIGCSQGIVTFLCARRGMRVLGVDIEEDRIEYARSELAGKPDEVRERVEFQAADAVTLDLPKDRFDTVLLGEVLEHLEDLDPLLAKVSRVCKPDGVIAITTPFGVFPHEDHSQTFFLASLVHSLRHRLTIEFLDIVDGYFRVSAKPGGMSEAEADRLVVELQPRYEERLADLHNELHLVRVRRKRLAVMARELDARLQKRRWEVRRLRRKRKVARLTRWSRLGAALARVRRRPGRILLLPRDLFRAARRLPAPPRPRRPRRLMVKLEQQWEPSSKHAELAIAAPHALKVSLPDVEVPAGPVARPELKVAALVDRFTATALRYEWDQVQFGPDDWRETVERAQPQLLFCESAWRGNDDRWRDRVVRNNAAQRKPLEELVAWFRERDIPTVFWNKEDPPNFGHFIDSAKLFDHVFTVDGECIPRYAEILGHERIQVLPFAAQPRIHNPVAVPGGRAHDVAFAGSYYMYKHPTRREQMETILAPARELGLDIFSRIIQGEDERFDWPAEYQPHIVGSLPYERMLAAYKAYKVFLNINSVVNSPTMCPRRVFELSACSTPVLSGSSRAIEEVFGELVPISRTPEETRAVLTAMLADGDGREERAHRAMREVFRHHTYGHRVEQVLRTAGLEVAPRDRLVSALVAVASAEQVASAAEQVARQSHRPLELVLAVAGDAGLDPAAAAAAARARGIEHVTAVAADPSLATGGRLNLALDAARGDLVAALDPDAAYEEHYLTDLVHAFSYTSAAVVGKRAGTEHAYIDELDAGTVVADADLARRYRFDGESPHPDAELASRAAANGTQVYAADRFSYAPAPARTAAGTAAAPASRRLVGRG